MLYEVIYYKFLGVNILEYSSILDVLISPVAVIVGDLKLLIGIIICIVLAVGYAKALPKYYTWLSKKKRYQSGKKKEKLDKTLNSFKTSSKQLVFVMIALYIIGAFVGFGIGRGGKIKKRIENDEIKVTHQLTFNDGESQKINMLGKNSLNIIYVIEGQKEVLVSPIEGNIKTIRKINN
jgi:predicted RND superfamily exporter protein